MEMGVCDCVDVCLFSWVSVRFALMAKSRTNNDRMNNTFMNNQNLIRPKVCHQKQGKYNVGVYTLKPRATWRLSECEYGFEGAAGMEFDSNKRLTKGRVCLFTVVFICDSLESREFVAWISYSRLPSGILLLISYMLVKGQLRMQFAGCLNNGMQP